MFFLIFLMCFQNEQFWIHNKTGFFYKEINFSLSILLNDESGFLPLSATH